MNDRNRRNVESGQRCQQWPVDYAGLIPTGSIFETKISALSASVDTVLDLLGQVASAVGEGLSATDVKGSERLDLIDIMEKIRNAARAAEFDHPGTRDRYRYDTSMSHQALLAAGRSFIIGSAADKTLLESYGAPTNWPTPLILACDAFEATFGQQASATGDRIGKNAAVAEEIANMVRLKNAITHMMPNFCSGNPAALAAWHSAAHVEAPPKKKTPTPPTP